MPVNNPTPDPAANALLAELLGSLRAVLGDHLVGMYLDGSLTTGDFDQDSDIDFVVVTDAPIPEPLFADLQAMHDRLAALDSVWAIQLEGSYLPAQALRRYDPAQDVHPNLERGQGERLKWVEHGLTWNIHRYVLRERGITLLGPAPADLIDPVSPDDLRQAMTAILKGWAAGFLENPAPLRQRGYQSYTVLSLCRILYTLEHGAVVSKPAAARWAQAQLDPAWTPLIERAWVGRHAPDGTADPDDVRATLDFIRLAQRRGQVNTG